MENHGTAEPNDQPPMAQPAAGISCAPHPTLAEIAVQPLAPVQPSERLTLLDALRGFALFGILMVNVTFFAFPFAHDESHPWWTQEPASAAARLFVELFCEFKFITLFSLLFGMGLGLQAERANKAGRPFGRFYARRMLLLLAFGLLHGFFIWYGDILTLYAVIGLIAILFHRLSNRTLLILAGVFFFIPMFGMTGCGLIAPNEDWKFEGWEDIGQRIETSATSARAEETDAGFAAVRAFLRFMDDEQRIYGRGPYLDQMKHRAVIFVVLMGKMHVLITGWRTLAMFLFGIVLIRWRLFDGSPQRRRTYVALALGGLLAGLSFEAAGMFILLRDPHRSFNSMLNFNALYVGAS